MTDDLQARFETAAKEVLELSQPPDQATMLQLYGLYKQVTAGDVAGERPGVLNLKKRFQYDAWKQYEGTSKEEAMQRYIDLVERLKAADAQ